MFGKIFSKMFHIIRAQKEFGFALKFSEIFCVIRAQIFGKILGKILGKMLDKMLGKMCYHKFYSYLNTLRPHTLKVIKKINCYLYIKNILLECRIIILKYKFFIMLFLIQFFM